MVGKHFLSRLSNAIELNTFNDLILLPGYSPIEPSEVDLNTKVTRNIRLKLPFVSSPMDTVTGIDMAISMARVGGLGILHRNNFVEEQVEMARKIKKFESLIIRDVITISPDARVGEAIRLMNSYNIHGLPVVDDGTLVGIVTWRDVRYTDENRFVREVMTGRDRIVYADENISIEEAKKLMHENRIEKLPIIDEEWRLKGLITFKDILLRDKYPEASRDGEGHLLVGAAISPYDLNRAKSLDRYVDVLVIDVAHFYNKNVISATKKIIREVSSEVIVGNLGTREAVLDVVSIIDNIAGIRVGIGSGSICKTGIVTRVAAPTLFATASAADALIELGAFGEIPIIADGGIKGSGDILLALASGASAVMMGNILAGTRESPGRLIAIEGRYYKEYYGMGSNRARRKMREYDRYWVPSKNIEEGVEGWVPYKGSVFDVIGELRDGLKAGMGYVGARNIEELWEKARFAKISMVGLEEIKPHSILTFTQWHR